LSRSAVEGMDGSERKEKNERQQGAAEEKERDNGVMGKKRTRGALQNKSSPLCIRENLRSKKI